MDAKVDRLATLVEQAASFLALHDGHDPDSPWLDWVFLFERDARLIREGDAYGLEHLVEVTRGKEGGAVDYIEFEAGRPEKEAFWTLLNEIKALASELWDDERRR